MLGKSLGKKDEAWYMLFGICLCTSCIWRMPIFCHTYMITYGNFLVIREPCSSKIFCTPPLHFALIRGWEGVQLLLLWVQLAINLTSGILSPKEHFNFLDPLDYQESDLLLIAWEIK